MAMKTIVIALALSLAPALAHAQTPPAESAAAPETLGRVVTLPEVVVSTARAGARTPVATTVLGREALQRINWGQDTPMALATLPGAYAYSDAGNGIGYSYLTIRGFPQRRISVLIDGVPLNDPESHEVYWIDHPDLLASTAEVQLQRGVGSALYGSPSLGGSVNLESAPFGTRPSATATLAYGSYRTRRESLEMDSGSNGPWNVYGRYSRIETDGYRDQSWSRLWSYFLSVRRQFERQSLRVNLFGGPETTHLAYKGVPQPYLDGQITGDADRDRRANLLAYPGEADHFFEPHYEIVHTWWPARSLDFAQTLFWFDGRGYYDEQRRDALGNYRLAPWAADTTLYPAAYFQDAYGQTIRDPQGRPLLQQTDLVRERFVANQHYGWAPRLLAHHRRGTLTVGGELRAHDGHHIGTVISGAALPPGTEPDHPYYDYHPRTLTAGLFVREEWQATRPVRISKYEVPKSAVTVTADLAWRHQTYRMRGDVYGGVRFDQSYDFLLPRLGVTVVPRKDWTLFGAWSYASREPRFIDLFNPEVAGSVPNYLVRDPLTQRLRAGCRLARPRSGGRRQPLPHGPQGRAGGLPIQLGSRLLHHRERGPLGPPGRGADGGHRPAPDTGHPRHPRRQRHARRQSLHTLRRTGGRPHHRGPRRQGHRVLTGRHRQRARAGGVAWRLARRRAPAGGADLPRQQRGPERQRRPAGGGEPQRRVARVSHRGLPGLGRGHRLQRVRQALRDRRLLRLRRQRWLRAPLRGRRAAERAGASAGGVLADAATPARERPVPPAGSGARPLRPRRPQRPARSTMRRVLGGAPGLASLSQ
ncbi:MAG: hypothetical protein E6K81_12255 [Candidatus Eisenbacteria bacterium]|uniref:TonB-dependent receptor n=1 Tax=Eiseniibacteriota bacterium TaxID=2212470 RepID=A0A538U4D9_UNCEI|nr:MAG: hypothetical protein E6K81_12255 [Candidatus Eisenbacteria bacterium]